MAKTFLGRIFDIQDTTDVERTVTSITKGSALKGFNVWILICSSILASIGLDVNSTAVIIGAMLISPLMNPILGVGLSLGINDRDLFIKALRNLAMATLFSLLASTFYFLVTPLGSITSELAARTKPTLLDVLVALFGGIAGIISSSRKESNNAIPGVAIATALMPPLCTAGFGIATGNWMYFLGAFYLFFINAVFISLSTYLIVKYLKFPLKEYVNSRTRKRYARLSAVLVALVLLPSVYFLYNVYSELRTKRKIEQLVIQPISDDGNEILKWEYLKKDSVTDVSIYYSGKAINEEKRKEMELVCEANGVDNCKLQVMRVNMTKEEITGLSEATSRRILEDMELKMAQQRLSSEDSAHMWETELLQVAREAAVAFDFIDSMWMGKTFMVKDSSRLDTLVNVWYKSRRPMDKKQERQVSGFIKLRLKTDTVIMRDL